MTPLSTANILWLTPAQRRMDITNPITKHSLSIQDKLKTRFGLQSKHNPLLSFLHNISFYPAWSSPISFSACTAGLIRAHHFFQSHIVNLFPTLCESHDLPSSETFCYLQINFLSHYTPPDLKTRDFTVFERSCTSDPHRRGLISDLYAQLLSHTTSSPPSYTNKWETDPTSNRKN